MKKQIAVGMLSAALAVTAQATLVSYPSGPVNLGIPDSSAGGVQSTILVPFGASVLDVNLYLNISGTFNGDIYATLSHGGLKAVLLNRVGKPTAGSIGYGDDGFDNLKLDDEAGTDVHLYGGNGGVTVVNGTYQPDGRNVDPFGSDVDFAAASRTLMLGVFDGMDAGGEWTLFVADAFGGDLHTLNPWTLELDVRDGGQVPDSSLGGVGFSAILFGGLLALARRRSWVHGN